MVRIDDGAIQVSCYFPAHSVLSQSQESRYCLVNQRLQNYLMFTGAEFAARMIYLGYTFHLEASAISHVEQTDLSLMKRLLD